MTEHLVTDAEVAEWTTFFKHLGNAPGTSTLTELADALLDTREALMEALSQEHALNGLGPCTCDTHPCLSQRLLNTLRGES